MRFKVYVDYTTEESPRPFYVGKGTERRVKLLTRNKLHTSISMKYGLDRRVIFETDDESAAFDKERELIAIHNTHVYSGGWGANFTIGGEGLSGMKYPDRKGENHPMWGKRHTEESKRKNSEANKIATAGENNGMFGKHHSEETKKKIGDNQRGWHHTDETKKVISNSLKGLLKGRKLSDETKRKISESRKGKKPWNKGKKLGPRKIPRTYSEQARKNISNSKKGKPTWNKGLKNKKLEENCQEQHNNLATIASQILLEYSGGRTLLMYN